MEKIVVVIEKSKDFMGAYAENCEGIYGAGETIDAVKADVLQAIDTIKREYPAEEVPAPLRGEYEIEWKIDVHSFLAYFSRYMSLAGMERATGINQRQLSAYLNRRSVPRRGQAERINSGLHKFASELLSVTV